MAQFSLQNLSISFGGDPILDAISFQVHKGERIALTGRNGEGKSTLLKILAGELVADSGEIGREKGLKTTRLLQEVPLDGKGTALDIVTAPLAAVLSPERKWEAEAPAYTALSRLGIEAEKKFSEMSGGQKRRCLLATAIAGEPDVLLLDEPTNHLDLVTIEWLEDFLLRMSCTLLIVTHDRAFLRRICTRILELDRGRLVDWDCDYTTFLQRRDALFEMEEKSSALFDKKLAQEEVWIRKGIQARRTRNEGRVRTLEQMRQERSERRERKAQVKMQIHKGESTGRLVIRAEKLCFSYPGHPIVDSLDLKVMRKDRIGILGPNGAGKTTLIRLLLKDIQATSGTIKTGEGLQVAWFDQLRSRLDQSQTLIENIGAGREHINMNGKSRHVLGYLQDFLFSPRQARGPISQLSGGEKNRLLLARLFAQPSNVLVLDEPTNDLDMETLDLLEDLLREYSGTVLLVSHDREFLDGVVSSILAFEGEARVKEYVGGYTDWKRQRPKKVPNSKKPRSAPRTKTPKKKNWKEERELEALPAKIDELEKKIAQMQENLNSPEMASDYQKIAEITTKMEDADNELLGAYERYETLSEL